MTDTSRLVRHYVHCNLWALPDWSAAPRGEDAQLAALSEAGVEMIQLSDLGAPPTSMPHGRIARVDVPSDADAVARRHRDEGTTITTLHVGTGMETDAEADALIGAVLEAGAKHDYPMPVETHRATVTQDPRRTLGLIERFPDLRINADLSHWYTGGEMRYGDFAARLDALTPVFERVRYMHGRIGTPGLIQAALTGPDDARQFVGDFREMWRRCAEGFLRTAEPDERLVFAPELLPHAATLDDGKGHQLFYYALEDEAGEELSDRWQQAFWLFEIMKQAMADAQGAT